MSRLPALLSAALAVSAAGCSSWSHTAWGTAAATADQPLRAAVIARHLQGEPGHAFVPRVDISDVVRPYLPPGMPLDDALALLARNGFSQTRAPAGAGKLVFADFRVSAGTARTDADCDVPYSDDTGKAVIGSVRCELRNTAP